MYFCMIPYKKKACLRSHLVLGLIEYKGLLTNSISCPTILQTEKRGFLREELGNVLFLPSYSGWIKITHITATTLLYISNIFQFKMHNILEYTQALVPDDSH